jgi:Flp pilus assembly pilin Flp
MSSAESEDAFLAAAPQKVRRRLLRRILLTLVTQYAIIATIVGLTVAATLHYVVTPKVVAQFEAIEAAFKRLPPR